MSNQGFVIALLTLDRFDSFSILYSVGDAGCLTPLLEQASILHSISDAEDRLSDIKGLFKSWYKSEKMKVIDAKILEVKVAPRVLKIYDRHGNPEKDSDFYSYIEQD